MTKKRSSRSVITKCGKVRYRDRIAALLSMARITKTDSSSRPKTERRAYFCPVCKGWHLTSRG